MNKKLYELIKRYHAEHYLAWDSLNRPYDEQENYDEEYEDTLQRKYEEGFSDALALVIELINKEDN
jgi:hypothetical protein